MEVKRIKKTIERSIACVVLCVGICACAGSDIRLLETIDIHPSEHVLLPLVPEYSLKIAGDSLQKQYPYWDIFNVFSVTGILYVDGKAYRFMGGDSQRSEALAPMTSENCTWKGKYSFLYPGDGWNQLEYNDERWWDGVSAYGSADYSYPVHTVWGAFQIYVRRHFHIANRDSLKGRKLYLRYIGDDQVRLYLNGDSVAQVDGFMFWPESKELPDGIWEKLRNGDNVLAAHGVNTGGQALVDYGLYVEKMEQSETDTACLQRVQVRTTQTSYLFQCGAAELQLDFASPSLLHRADMTGCPVGLISYSVNTKDNERHDIKISFDLDTENADGMEYWKDGDMNVVKCDSLYVSMMNAVGIECTSENGHVVFSQKTVDGDRSDGVLLVGYGKKQVLQYAGEGLLPYWNSDGKKNVAMMLRTVAEKYQRLKEGCDRMDERWDKDCLSMVDKEYAGEMITNYRNFAATHHFMRNSDGELLCFGDSLGSVRLAYNNLSTLLFFNRMDWLKGLLNPIFGYCENGENWLRKYPPYDIGKYPTANYQLEDNKDGVESAADMLMMVLALVKAEEDFDYADLHWKMLCQWADYLEHSEQEMHSDGLLDGTEKLEKRKLGLNAYQELKLLKEKL